MNFLGQHKEAAFLGTSFAETDVFLESVPPAVLDAAATSMVRGRAVWPSRSAVYRKNLFNNSTLVDPKTTWSAIGGYDEGLSLCEDYDFYLRAMQRGPAALLPGHTVLWYTNPGGFFKQKGMREYLAAMSAIKQRARRVLGLPWWMRFYHPLWVRVYTARRWYSSLKAGRALRGDGSTEARSV
jgi:hypothetical protein